MKHYVITGGREGQIINGLNEAATDAEIMISMPRIFQTWSRRA